MPHSLHGVELAVDMATAKEGRVRPGTPPGFLVEDSGMRCRAVPNLLTRR